MAVNIKYRALNPVVHAETSVKGAPLSNEEIDGNFKNVKDAVEVIQGAGGAAAVGFTPTGTVAATNVQSAINEVVSDLASGTGASLVGYIPAGTGAVATTVQAALDSVGLLEYTEAEAKLKTFYNGERVYIKDRGNVYKYRSSRNLISGQAQSELMFDDTLHILVTAGGMLQFDDWAIIRQKHTSNLSRFAAKLTDRTSQIRLDCYGDSITFGQALPSTAGATNKIGSETGFGDGSVHEQWQFNANYPTWISTYLTENLLQSNVVSNFGYSGDRMLTGYLRHRVETGSDVATIMYGVNDCLYATSNGSNPAGLNGTGIYPVKNYAEVLRLFVAKQIMQGKAVTVLGTTPFGSLVGFDGTPLAATKLTRAYNAAAKRVAEEFGCRFVDVCQDIFNQYGLEEILQEGTHLGVNGLKIAGQRIAAALVTAETENRVSHGSVLIANPSLNCLLSKSAVNVTANSSSTAPKGTLDNQRTSVAVSTDWVSIPFYAESGSLLAFVNGSASGGSATFDVYIDGASVQSDFHFQHTYFIGKPTGGKRLTKSSAFNRDNINITDDAGGCYLHVANRGWHTISIRKVSGSGTLLLDSISFESFESVVASDIYGVTASCSVTSGALDSSKKNFSSVTQTYPGEFDFVLSNNLVNNKYTVSVDVNETNADPITITTRFKTSNAFNISFNKWNGTAWVRFAPSLFTVKVIGGR